HRAVPGHPRPGRGVGVEAHDLGSGDAGRRGHVAGHGFPLVRLDAREVLARAWRHAPARSSRLLTAHAIMKQPGIVRIQPMTIWPATPQRTADKRRVEPTPRIAELIVWVVETGTPSRLAAAIIAAAADSAGNTWVGQRVTQRR